MIHLFKNSNGKLNATFDAVTIEGSDVVWRTPNQGYERRAGVIKAIRSGMKSFGSDACYFQDDTVTPSIVYVLYGKEKPQKTHIKPKKPYVPSSQK